MDLRVPGFFLRREVNVAAENCGLDREAQAGVQKLDESMDRVVWPLIAMIYQRIGALNLLGFGIVIRQAGEMRIVLPEIRTRRSDIGYKLPRMAKVQIAHGRGQQHDVTRGKMTLEDQLPHR